MLWKNNDARIFSGSSSSSSDVCCCTFRAWIENPLRSDDEADVYPKINHQPKSRTSNLQIIISSSCQYCAVSRQPSDATVPKHLHAFFACTAKYLLASQLSIFPFVPLAHHFFLRDFGVKLTLLLAALMMGLLVFEKHWATKERGKKTVFRGDESKKTRKKAERPQFSHLRGWNEIYIRRSTVRHRIFQEMFSSAFHSLRRLFS